MRMILAMAFLLAITSAAPASSTELDPWFLVRDGKGNPFIAMVTAQTGERYDQIQFACIEDHGFHVFVRVGNAPRPRIIQWQTDTMKSEPQYWEYSPDWPSFGVGSDRLQAVRLAFAISQAREQIIISNGREETAFPIKGAMEPITQLMEYCRIWSDS